MGCGKTIAVVVLLFALALGSSGPVKFSPKKLMTFSQVLDLAAFLLFPLSNINILSNDAIARRPLQSFVGRDVLSALLPLGLELVATNRSRLPSVLFPAQISTGFL